MTIIEFVGLPGSGKSMLVSQLAREFSQLGGENTLRRGSNFPRLWAKVSTSIRYARVLVISVLALKSDRRSFALRLRSLRWLLTTLEAYTLKGDGVELIAEGTLQRALLLFFKPGMEVDRRILRRYLARVPLADLVVRLVISPSEAAGRNRIRGSDPDNGRMNARFMEADEEPDVVFEKAEEFIQCVMAEVVHRRGVEVITVEAGGDLEVQELLDEILTRLPIES